jgi:hypothetical protein
MLDCTTLTGAGFPLQHDWLPWLLRHTAHTTTPACIVPNAAGFILPDSMYGHWHTQICIVPEVFASQYLI